MTTTLPSLGLRTELIVVRGEPVTQGSKQGFAVRRKDAGAWVYTGSVAMVESGDSQHKERNRAWRSVVQDAAEQALAGRPPLDGAVGFRATFSLRRPKGHFGTGRNAAVLKPSAPRYPSGKPDEEKLSRSVKDALRDAGVYADDAQVTDSHVCKRYALAWWAGDGTAAIERLPDPTILCGVPDADVLAVPGVVIRLWELR